MTSLVSTIQTLAAPVGRLLLAAIFLISGLGKISGYTGTQGYMEMMGVPGGLLPLVIAVEVLGAVALILGWNARFAAFLLGGFSVVSGILFHLVPSFGMEGMEAQMQFISFLKNVSIGGGMGMIVALGAGAFSLDNRSVSAG
ncbi:DoxX family protein [Seohaeicola zhoushanensis]|uniref:Membrane protein n=1 Tax=Seohaeicola zhoushanensis TaxID=1569283 RepID=A0A8J3H053_9RHOB|nr:DoxX family protein [Seohaeicola zhoushanensis]GHF66523.1 membrane protein [Seohaeicola zhoushanensis]